MCEFVMNGLIVIYLTSQIYFNYILTKRFEALTKRLEALTKNLDEIKQDVNYIAYIKSRF